MPRGLAGQQLDDEVSDRVPSQSQVWWCPAVLLRHVQLTGHGSECTRPGHHRYRELSQTRVAWSHRPVLGLQHDSTRSDINTNAFSHCLSCLFISTSSHWILCICNYISFNKILASFWSKNIHST